MHENNDISIPASGALARSRTTQINFYNRLCIYFPRKLFGNGDISVQ